MASSKKPSKLLVHRSRSRERHFEIQVKQGGAPTFKELAPTLEEEEVLLVDPVLPEDNRDVLDTLSPKLRKRILSKGAEILKSIENMPPPKPCTRKEYKERVAQLDTAGGEWLSLVRIQPKNRPMWAQKLNNSFINPYTKPGEELVRLMWLDEYGRRCTNYIPAQIFYRLFEEKQEV